MQAAEVHSSGNMILNSFEPECREFLDDRSLTKPIGSGEVLHESGARLKNVVFPHEGLVSLQYKTKDGRIAEMTSVGAKGAVGIMNLLANDQPTYSSVTVISGRATWVAASDLAEALKKFPSVRPALRTYLHSRIQEQMQAAACASLHTAMQRLSTWLLRAEDASNATKFDITQRMLSDILGFRLATISDCCNKLRNAGVIDYSRGNLGILDRDLLKEEACECYESPPVSKPATHLEH